MALIVFMQRCLALGKRRSLDTRTYPCGRSKHALLNDDNLQVLLEAFATNPQTTFDVASLADANGEWKPGCQMRVAACPARKALVQARTAGCRSGSKCHSGPGRL
jgi:hypothetical protein